MKRTLVTGASGQLGLSIQDIHKNYPDLTFVFKDSKELDITNFESVEETIGSGNYDFVINCAAYTNVEQAEKTPEMAFRVNAEGVKNIAVSCKNNNIALIHISTDYVFDGEKEGPYTVHDIPNPINEYGKSKWEGEKHVQEILSNYFIVRTSWLYSKKHGKNFYRTILKKAEQGEELRVTDKQIGSPTQASNLACYIVGLIVKQGCEHGISNYTDQEIMTWYGFAKKILLDNDLNEITKVVKDNNYRSFARRPKNSVLI